MDYRNFDEKILGYKIIKVFTENFFLIKKEHDFYFLDKESGCEPYLEPIDKDIANLWNSTHDNFMQQINIKISNYIQGISEMEIEPNSGMHQTIPVEKGILKVVQKLIEYVEEQKLHKNNRHGETTLRENLLRLDRYLKLTQVLPEVSDLYFILEWGSAAMLKKQWKAAKKLLRKMSSHNCFDINTEYSCKKFLYEIDQNSRNVAKVLHKLSFYKKSLEYEHGLIVKDEGDGNVTIKSRSGRSNSTKYFNSVVTRIYKEFYIHESHTTEKVRNKISKDLKILFSNLPTNTVILDCNDVSTTGDIYKALKAIK